MTMRDSIPPFLVGIGVGVAAAALLGTDGGRKTRDRVAGFAGRAAEAAKRRAQDIGDTTKDVLDGASVVFNDERKKRSETVADLKNKAKDTVDDTADAARHAASKIVTSSKDAAHSVGKALEYEGKRLQDA